MSEHAKQSERLTMRIAHRDDPVSQVTDADAWDRHRSYPYAVLRGPLFGFAGQREGDTGWRLLSAMCDSHPQGARDGLNSHLWFKAKDDTDDPAQRRELLAAVARLETEAVDELSACGVRYRIVRGDEFARVGPDGMEPPRPTDPSPTFPTWDFRSSTPSRIKGFVIDHAEATGMMEGLERMALMHLCYTAEQYPRDVREDSAHALETHPGVVLLPATFVFVEEKEGTWEPMIAPQPTPHDARRVLVNAMEEFWPQMYGFDSTRTALYARAAAEYRSLRDADTLRVDGRCFRIARTQTLVRVGPGGPEGPRPSDVDITEPMRMHPVMDENGEITYEE